MIGYMIKEELGNVLPFERPIATLFTMIEVDPADPAFQSPTKFIGPTYPKMDADRLAAEKGWFFRQDGLHWRSEATLLSDYTDGWWRMLIGLDAEEERAVLVLRLTFKDGYLQEAVGVYDGSDLSSFDERIPYLDATGLHLLSISLPGTRPRGGGVRIPGSAPGLKLTGGPARVLP